MRIRPWFLIALLAVAGKSLSAASVREITVFLRVDDVFMLESKLEPREISGFLGVAEKHGARVMLATVPNRLLQRTNRDGLMTSEILAASARGHQVSQHGFDHRCMFTGNTGREFSTSEALTLLTQDQRIAKILDGRRLLEAVTGKVVSTYVGPGADDGIVLERDRKRLRAEGYAWLRDESKTGAAVSDGLGTYPWMGDYTWAITGETYAQRLAEAQEQYRKVTAEGDQFGLLFHDHFTRRAYNNGITLRWLDEMLTWLESQPGVRIRYATLDDYYAGKTGARPARGAMFTSATLVKLQSDALCNRCVNHLLPGRHIPSPRTSYRIDSDLPEMFRSNGVLYTTRELLPPFQTKSDGPVPESMRRQRNAGFRGVDGSFEVFLYHLSMLHAPGETRRVVVYAQNNGTTTVTVRPRQAMFHGPNAGRPGSVESRLGEAVLAERWDHPLDRVLIGPGEGAIVGHTLQLGAARDTDDTVAAMFVTGLLRAAVETPDGSPPDLEISIVSIPGSPRAGMAALARKWLEVGADSNEGAMDLRIVPPGCHVRRVVGTARNVLWRNDPMALDLGNLPADRFAFQMAMFGVQSQGCMEARQSTDLLLHPGYVHPDSVGNFMMETMLTWELDNGSSVPRTLDIQFGKDDAPIGLGWQLSLADQARPAAEIEALPVQIGWAGKGAAGMVAPDFAKSMLKDGPVKLGPGAKKFLQIRLMVLGTSSLPYQIHFVTRPD